MKTIMTALAVVTLAMGVTGCGASSDGDAAATASDSSIVGTWTVNLDSAEWDNANSNYVLADGQYTCNSCIPPFSMTADGEWQKVDRPGVDELRYAIIDDNTVETGSRFEGEELGSSTRTVSEDGNSLTITWTNLSGDKPVTGESRMTRVAAGPAGSHAVSGEWAPDRIESMSEPPSVTISLDGDTITFAGSNGGGYTAVLGGEAVTIEDDNSGTLVAIEKTGANTYRETFTRDGEVTSVNDWTISGDTVNVVSNDPRDNSSVSWSATRK